VTLWALAAPLARCGGRGGRRAEVGALASPLLKVVALIEQLEKRVAADDLEDLKVYNQYVTQCSTVADRRTREIQEYGATREALEAAVMKGNSDAAESNSQIAELSEALSADEAELKSAAAARESESTEHEAVNKELLEVLETLERAMAVLQKEMGKTGAAGSTNFLQRPTPGLRLFEAAIQEVVDSAAAVASDDELQRLSAMVQGSSQEDPAGQPAAPDPGYTAPVMQALQDLKERTAKAQAELREKEAAARHNFELLKASLTDRMQTDQQEIEDSRKGLAQAQQEAALAEKRLHQTDQDLTELKQNLLELQHVCMSRATDHAKAAKERKEELRALAEARKHIVGSPAAGAAAQYASTPPRNS